MRFTRRFLLRVLWLVVFLPAVQADENVQSKTVIGPSNPLLHDGASALIAGDGEEGVRLTLMGLEVAHGNREQKTGHANLCAGFILVNQAEKALPHCDWVLERDSRHWKTYNNRALAYLQLERYEESEADIRAGQELRPGSTNLKIVKGMYLDQIEPVRPRVEIDDRRNATDEHVEDQTDEGNH